MTAILQRPLRGSRISSFYPVKSLPSLSSLDSAFQLQEYISLLIRLDVHDVDSIVSLPGRGDGKEKEAEDSEDVGEKDPDKERKTEVAVDEACWIYEQLRRLAQDLSHPLITMLQQECTRGSCPEMKAGEWQYLCVAHGTDGAMEQCCAIDYILHTVDSATALLNSPRAFPSRLSIPQTSNRHFSSLARRLGRIFAHAYFHHREAFEQAEAESSLYARFLALTSKFNLVPPEFLVIPPRLSANDNDDRRNTDVQPPRLLAAAVDPQGDRERERELSHGQEQEAGSSDQQWDPANLSVVQNVRSKSKSPPGLGSDSPRRLGRNRTDTMVFSDAHIAIEELAKAEDKTETGSPQDVEANAGSSEERALHKLEPVVVGSEAQEIASPEDDTQQLQTEPASGEPGSEQEVLASEAKAPTDLHVAIEEEAEPELAVIMDAVDVPLPTEQLVTPSSSTVIQSVDPTVAASQSQEEEAQPSSETTADMTEEIEVAENGAVVVTPATTDSPLAHDSPGETNPANDTVAADVSAPMTDVAEASIATESTEEDSTVPSVVLPSKDVSETSTNVLLEAITTTIAPTSRDVDESADGAPKSKDDTQAGSIVDDTADVVTPEVSKISNTEAQPSKTASTPPSEDEVKDSAGIVGQP